MPTQGHFRSMRLSGQYNHTGGAETIPCMEPQNNVREYMISDLLVLLEIPSIYRRFLGVVESSYMFQTCVTGNAPVISVVVALSSLVSPWCNAKLSHHNLIYCPVSFGHFCFSSCSSTPKSFKPSSKKNTSVSVMAIFDVLQTISISQLLISFVIYCIYVATYRLYFSPISAFPGPKLAAVTLWYVNHPLIVHCDNLYRYEFFYDNVLRGRYIFKVIELHKKYGPIVRISPYELHVANPEFYETLYASTASGEKRNKYAWFTKAFGMDSSVFATPDHDIHRLRRAALNPFFSIQSVRRLQPVIQERVDTLMIRMRDFQRSEEVLMASWMFAAFTNGRCFCRALATYSKYAWNTNRSRQML